MKDYRTFPAFTVCYILLCLLVSESAPVHKSTPHMYSWLGVFNMWVRSVSTCLRNALLIFYSIPENYYVNLKLRYLYFLVHETQSRYIMDDLIS